MLGLFFGPNQSSSRAFMARIAPDELKTQSHLLYFQGKQRLGLVLFYLDYLLIWNSTSWHGGNFNPSGYRFFNYA